MTQAFWVRCATVGATVALMGAGCTAQTSVQTDTTDTGTGTTSAAEGTTTGVGTSTSVDIKTDGTNTTVTTDAAPTAVTVTISGDGFSPASVTVKKGTTITFVNKGSTAHWPASDPHPTHTTYPEFNSKKEIASGASWTFTFDKVGTWRYHDHLNSGEKGVIIVTE